MGRHQICVSEGNAELSVTCAHVLYDPTPPIHPSKHSSQIVQRHTNVCSHKPSGRVSIYVLFWSPLTNLQGLCKVSKLFWWVNSFQFIWTTMPGLIIVWSCNLRPFGKKSESLPGHYKEYIIISKALLLHSVYVLKTLHIARLLHTHFLSFFLLFNNICNNNK